MQAEAVQVCWRTTGKDISWERCLRLGGRGKNRTDATCVWAPNFHVLAKKEKNKLYFFFFLPISTVCHTELKGLSQGKVLFIYLLHFVFLFKTMAKTDVIKVENNEGYPAFLTLRLVKKWLPVKSR